MHNPNTTQCDNCTTCTGGYMEFDNPCVHFVEDGVVCGSSTPLHSVTELSRQLDINPKAIPYHLSQLNRPVYSVGNEFYIDMADLKFLIEAHGILPCMMRD